MFFTTTDHLALVKIHQEVYIGSMTCVSLSPWKAVSGQCLGTTLFLSSACTVEISNCLSTETVLVLACCLLNNFSLLWMFISTLHPSAPSLWHLSWWKQSRVDRIQENNKKNLLILNSRKQFRKIKNKIYIHQSLLKIHLKYAQSLSQIKNSSSFAVLHTLLLISGFFPWMSS